MFPFVKLDLSPFPSPPSWPPSSLTPSSLGSLSTDVFETRTATECNCLVLPRADLIQSVGKSLFQHFKLNSTDKRSVASTREKNSQIPAAVRVSKTSVLIIHNSGRSNLDIGSITSRCSGNEDRTRENDGNRA